MESRRSFQNSWTQQQWSRREYLKFQLPYAYAKTNTCCFHSTDLADSCSFYLLFVLQILPILSSQSLISFPRPDPLDFSSSYLYFPLLFPLLICIHLTYTIPDFYLEHKVGFSSCAMQPSAKSFQRAIKHERAVVSSSCEMTAQLLSVGQMGKD